jgi:hypothetical protein
VLPVTYEPGFYIPEDDILQRVARFAEATCRNDVFEIRRASINQLMVKFLLKRISEAPKHAR